MLDEFLVWAEVDLDAIAHNVAAIKQHVGEKVEVMAVVKANAYGHGLRQVSQVALDNGASRLVLNHIQAAVTLRNAGIVAPILVMGYVPLAGVYHAVEHGLVLTVTSSDLAQAVSNTAVGLGKTMKVHLKVDTGMGRFGLSPEEAVSFAQWLTSLPGVELEGVYTHLATADARDRSFAYEQITIFEDVVASLTSVGIRVPVKHVANSAATLAMPDAHMDAVRPGVAIYGLYPSDETDRTVDLRPALSLKSRVGRIRTLPQGHSVSYRRTFVAQEPTTVALVPCGYGDGYMRLTSNRGAVLVHGQRAPIRGRVCMDQLVVDVSEIDDVKLDDEVVLIGRQGEDAILADDVATWAETINYEIVTHLLPRVPRVYRQRGEIVSVMEGWQ
jgi:alanine racemase